ncbi:MULTISPECIES: TetR family transcriptional regulator [unclassified Streptomyces]|uniref:TetR family transcriptional regulator n=1 Tax=unclassified Streptomyces TaxID=2593676 RepID=UPI002B1DAC8F|nr:MULTISPECIES: TetR family transcriptional regulator [unclassified Streptomyces]
MRTAIKLADAKGMSAVSMRRVTTMLATSTMALYHHVPGKAELVRLMSDEVFGERRLGAELHIHLTVVLIIK